MRNREIKLNPNFLKLKRSRRNKINSLAMEGRRFERFDGEGEKRAWMEKREGGEKALPTTRERKEKWNEIFWCLIQINILYTRNYQIALTLSVLNTTPILFPCYVDMSIYIYY
jgi:hypothetical protein